MTSLPDLDGSILHLPKPGELRADALKRTALLAGVRYLIVVGSPRRARRIAELAHERFGARHDAAASCYCDLTVPGRDETGREFAVYGVELAGGARLAVASHGVGKAGVELVLSELPALISLASGEPIQLRGVLRCGTRGALCRAPLGCVALTTRAHGENLAAVTPDATWLEHLRAAARARGMTFVADDEIDARGEDEWPDPAELLVEGPGISTSFFWQGQGRVLYRPHPDPADIERELAEGHARLTEWVRAGIRWIEMEDATVIRVAGLCGIPAATLGAVVGHRRRADGGFQSGYNKATLAVSELLPAELALAAVQAAHEGRT